MGESERVLRPGNAELLDAFLLSHSYKPGTKQTYEMTLFSYDEFGVLADASQQSVREWWKAREGELSPSTVQKYADNLRRMLEHSYKVRGDGKREAKLKAEDVFDVVPMRDLRERVRKENHVADKLVKKDEFRVLLEGAKHPRSKALVSVLYDSACRKGELLALKNRHVEDHGDYVLVRVHGKTGERPIYLKESMPALKTWLAMHPDPRPDQYLFATTINGKTGKMSVNALNTLLNYICENAGIRPIYPHMLRHTKLTHLAADPNINEAILKKIAGWIPSSKMADVYIHLSGRDVKRSFLAAQGVDVEQVEVEEREPFFEMKGCPKCGYENDASQAFCGRCGYILDESLGVRTVLERDEEMKTLRHTVETLNEGLRNVQSLLGQFSDEDVQKAVRKGRRARRATLEK